MHPLTPQRALFLSNSHTSSLCTTKFSLSLLGALKVIFDQWLRFRTPPPSKNALSTCKLYRKSQIKQIWTSFESWYFFRVEIHPLNGCVRCGLIERRPVILIGPFLYFLFQLKKNNALLRLPGVPKQLYMYLKF